MFTGSKDRACDIDSREDHGKRKGRNHYGSRRVEQRGQEGDNGDCGQIQEATEVDEGNYSWTNHPVRNPTSVW